jgi:hypothetical protein
MKEERPHNSTYPKGGVSCSKDSFVVNQTLVFQIKFCGKSPALRVAANRYAQCRWTKLTLRALAHLHAALSIATPKQAKEPTFPPAPENQGLTATT